jgi:gamma-glutamyl-gamma-aminobutyrate hydrolase PuuD
MNLSELPLIVAVTQRVDSIAHIGEKRDAIAQNLLLWLTEAGFLPVQVPNILEKQSFNKFTGKDNPNILADWLTIIKPRAMVLSGGNDIGECPERDATEAHLLSWASKHHIPVLGICRGLQMMASWAGSGLIKVEGHVRTRHQLRLNEQDDNYPDNVNSFHNWALDGCPPGFRIMALAEDGTIEAVTHNNLSWEGWMWHPEREMPFSTCDTQRLKNLFNG